MDNEIKKVLIMNELFDLYGELLSAKQQQIFIDYYEENLSLSEIAENYKISRNAVFDSLKKSENSLLNYEEKMRFLEKTKELNTKLMSLFETEHIDDYALKILKGE